MVPTNRHFRAAQDSTKGTLGFTQPLSMDLPGYCAVTSTPYSRSTSTRFVCTPATAKKRGAGMGGGVASSGALTHFALSSIHKLARISLAFCASGFF